MCFPPQDWTTWLLGLFILPRHSPSFVSPLSPCPLPSLWSGLYLLATSMTSSQSASSCFLFTNNAITLLQWPFSNVALAFRTLWSQCSLGHCLFLPSCPADWEQLESRESSDSILHMQHLTFMEIHCWLLQRRKQQGYSPDMMNIANSYPERGRSFQKQLIRMGAHPPFTAAPHFVSGSPKAQGSYLQAFGHAVP